MTNFEKIKKFINEKIFHKKDQKLLMPGSTEIKDSDEKIDFSKIFKYIENERYVKNFKVSFVELSSKARKNLLKRIKNDENETCIHDSFPIVEGFYSEGYFISVRRNENNTNKIGQTIITENSYIDISIRKKHKSAKYTDLYYKEFRRNGDVEALYQFDQENESYYRQIKQNGITFIESASYGNEEKIREVEYFAQPSDEEILIKEYMKITGLSYIANEPKKHISDIIKADPYIVNIQGYKNGKNNLPSKQVEIIKVFKSKKECIVGYRPEMIFLKGVGDTQTENKMFRLLPEGLYIDNSSFKSNFEDRYSVRKIDLNGIENLFQNLPFSLSEETKTILRNGLELQNHIKTIFDKANQKI